VEGRGKVEEYRAGSKHRVSVMAMPCIWGGRVLVTQVYAVIKTH